MHLGEARRNDTGKCTVRLLVREFLVQIDATGRPECGGQRWAEFLPQKRGEMRICLDIFRQRRRQGQRALGQIDGTTRFVLFRCSNSAEKEKKSHQ